MADRIIVVRGVSFFLGGCVKGLFRVKDKKKGANLCDKFLGLGISVSKIRDCVVY